MAGTIQDVTMKLKTKSASTLKIQRHKFKKYLKYTGIDILTFVSHSIHT